MTSYTYRRTACETCNGTRIVEEYVPNGLVSRTCEDCGGFGRVDADCAECLAALPLNEDGVCEKCHDASSLPIGEFDEKYGLVAVEVLEPRDGRERRAA